MTAYLLDANHISPLVTIAHPLRQKTLAQAQTGHRTETRKLAHDSLNDHPLAPCAWHCPPTAISALRQDSSSDVGQQIQGGNKTIVPLVFGGQGIAPADSRSRNQSISNEQALLPLLDPNLTNPLAAIAQLLTITPHANKRLVP